MGALLLSAVAASADTPLTFQVDMTGAVQNATFNPAVQTVAARGTFDGWGTPGFVLTNDLAAANTNLYTGVFDDTLDANGGETVWQFVLATGGTINTYEQTADYNNRAALLPATSGASYTLPYLYWEDDGGAITNMVTFQVDMSEQIYLGTWSPTANTVEVRGNFQGWSGGTTLTNNPLVLVTNGQGIVTSNVYQITLPVMNCTNAANDFKYVTQPGTGWDSPSAANSDNGGNRWFINSSNQTLPAVYFSDQVLNESASALIDFVTVPDCMVTFTVEMTNAVGTDGTIFDNNASGSADAVYLNGINNGADNSFWGWGSAFPPANYQMTQEPNSTLFTITLPVNQGQSDLLIYKYGLNGADDEAGFADNHERWIRSLPNYTMPVDTFGSQGATTQVEIPAGDLTASVGAGNQVQLSWLGRRGVHLQTSPTLDASAVWTDQYLTDGTNLLVAPGGMASTNYTIGPGNLYFRLVGPK